MSITTAMNQSDEPTMNAQFEYSKLADSGEARQLNAILSQCFNDPSDDEPDASYFDRIGLENFRVICQAGQMAGGLALLHMGQWFGGERVPMTGIAAVGIAPEARGSGAAIALIQQALQELYATGVPISVLYPATQRLYRKAGYEQGGSLFDWEISTDSIQIKERPLPVRSVTPLNHEIFHTLYQQQAKYTNGNLDRNSAIWQERTQPEQKEPIFGYLLGSTEQPEGYLIFSQHRIENTSILRIKDWVALTPAAGQSFWTFLADHRSQIRKVQWRGTAIDPLMLLLPEQTAKIRSIEYWMLRVVNVVSALEKRGYPTEIETELHLQVHDDLLSQNNGKFILSVASGQGKVTQGGKGELQLNIRGLAPLYTGLFTPRQLQSTGQLTATETALATATSLFSGTSPWMPDFF